MAAKVCQMGNFAVLGECGVFVCVFALPYWCFEKKTPRGLRPFFLQNTALAVIKPLSRPAPLPLDFEGVGVLFSVFRSSAAVS